MGQRTSKNAQASGSASRAPRRIAALVVVVALVGGGVLVARLARRNDSKSTATAAAASAASAFKTAQVESGDLTTSERIDGSVVLATSTKVLHRVAGSTSSVSSASSSSASSARSSAASTGASSPAVGAVGQAATAIDCSAPGGPPAASTTLPPSPLPPQSTTTAPVTPTSDSATTTTDPTASTTTPVVIPTTSVPVQPVQPVDTTTPGGGQCATTTTAPATGGGFGAGGAGGSGGAGGGTGASRAGSTSAGSSTAGAGARITQTITSVIADGAAVTSGDILYTVDGQPVVLLAGQLPAWRTMKVGVTDGPDVQQLETSLVSLGYDRSATVTIDQHYDAATKKMVKAWQAGLGVTATGEVALGSVAFLNGTSDVTNVAVSVGDTVGDGDAVLTLAAATENVVIDVPSGDEQIIVPGLAVDISGTPGTVSLLRSTDRNGAVVVQAVISPSAPLPDVANGGSVKVTVASTNATGVLLVPAAALASRLDGSYAVQIKEASGAVTWHVVDMLGISGSKVGIRGDGITAGLTVLVPA